MATRTFTDLDLTFEPHPATGDLMVRRDVQAVKNSIKNLVLTKHYERAFHSEIGSSATSLLFESPNPGMVALLKREIELNIRNFEPRADILSVDVGFSPDNNSVGITVYFKIVNTNTPVSVQFVLDRTR